MSKSTGYKTNGCDFDSEAGTVVRRSSQTNMNLVRNRLHTRPIHPWHRNAGSALPSRHYVQPTHTRPAASVTPVEKILLDTIKVHASRIFQSSAYPNTDYGIGKWTRILRNIHATLPLSPNRGLLYETRKRSDRCSR